ncbi:MAG: DUF4115 domain-containing protein [Lysobacteraceae bacterium]|mgnify:CR=1 FL=1|nr:DUF4115 domain-containing protein [Xanthomonadaceae bacterium]HRX99484.1 DUF4115 domain-containing protein [Xanthomonadaceae bacterium]
MSTEMPPHQQSQLGDGEQGWDRPLGLLLREARQKKDLSTADVGRRLHVTSAIVEAIERNDFERLGASVYARGYLNSYARLVGVPTAHVDRALSSVDQQAPPLKSASHTPHWQYLYDRYAKRVMYIALTGVIVFPIVLMGLRDRLPIEPPRLLSLDGYGSDDAGSVSDADDSKAPVTASMAPFYREAEPISAPPSVTPDDVNRPADSTEKAASLAIPAIQASQEASPVSAAAGSPASAAATGQLTLVFNGTSWVEVLSRNGRRLAYGLIAAGEVRSFDSAEVGRIAIGDADAVSVSLDGRTLNLKDFRHAKVVRFALSSAGEPIAPGG